MKAVVHSFELRVYGIEAIHALGFTPMPPELWSMPAANDGSMFHGVRSPT